MIYLVAAAVTVALGVSIWILISQLRSKHASSVHAVWYLFSLALCTSMIVLEWASEIGAIDLTGNAGNELGKTLMKLLTFTLDLPSDLYALSALVALIVVPQLFSYLASGLFGCASRPKFVAHCVDFFAWGMAKSFAVASGALISLPILGSIHHWHGFDTKAIVKYALLSMMLMLFSFMALLARSTLDEIPILAQSQRLEPLRRWLRSVDNKMVRHRNRGT